MAIIFYHNKDDPFKCKCEFCNDPEFELKKEKLKNDMFERAKENLKQLHNLETDDDLRKHGHLK